MRERILDRVREVFVMDSLSIRAGVRRARVLPVLAVWLAIGCGAPPMAEVSGEVTYNGEPLPTGTIAFMTDDVPNRYQIATTIIRNGRYFLPKVACGNVRITVNTPPNTKREPSIEIPKDFADMEKSGLTYTVKPESQTFDIKLSGPPAPPRLTKERRPSPDEMKEKRRMEMKKKQQEQKE
jgi:hypothetical protein